MAADRIHIAEPAPPRCSGCDGPVVPAAENVAGLVGHVIDDLILCETCITEAAQLVGLGNAAALTAERDQLEAGNRELRAKLAGFEDYAAKLEAALAAKPEPRKPDNRKVAQNRQKAKA
jgi:hypothetical protein